MGCLDSNGVPLEMLSFDSCLMSTIETHFELRHATRFITADEDYTPWTGIVSPRFQTILSRNTSSESKVVALARDQAEANQGIKDPSDITVVKTRHVGALVGLVRSFGLTSKDFKKAHAVDKNDTSFENDLHAVVMGSKHVTPAQERKFEKAFARTVSFYEMNHAKTKVMPNAKGISILKTPNSASFTKKQKAAMNALDFYAQ